MLFPPKIRWNVTMSCNLSCRHCQVGHKLQRNVHPSREHLYKILSRFNQHSVSHIGLLGGEPLIVPYIHEVLIDLNDKLIPYTVTTNGQILEEHVLKILAESARVNIMVSINGPDEASHDLIRGKGAFKNAVSNVRRMIQVLRSYDIHIGMGCTF